MFEDMKGKMPTDEEEVAWLTKKYPDLAKQYENALSIVQIKGPGNKAPATKHLPFIQDFIRSGQWSDIQDAAHTGLTKEEINAILNR